VPKASVFAPACIAGTAATPACPAPLVIFRHGLNSSRASMLLVADRLTAAGFVVAAIDAAKHGARSYCMPAKDAAGASDCVAGSSCVPDSTLAGQGDAAGNAPGKCSGATATDPKFVNKPVLCPAGGCTTAITNAGTPAASGNYLISSNLFRTRDSLRQDIIDQSQLIHVLAVNPTAPPAGADIFTAISQTGVVIDPTKVYFVGQSLGGISGEVDVAVNPRVTKAVFNVAGGTIVDVFSNSPSLSPSLNALLTSIGITPGTPAYLQFLTVAKWVLDPADPINFAQRVTTNTLPNLIKSGLPPPLNADPMVPKKVLGQMAACDATVPNPFTAEMFGLLGLGPDATGGTTTFEQFVSASGHTTACPGGVVKHGFLGDWVDYPAGAASIAQQGQDDIAAFFATDTHPPATPRATP
jgi:hypothetical protein